MLDRLAAGLARALRIDGLDAPENRLIVRAGLCLAIAGMILRLFFWAYTQRYWEDALITCLHSENFARGLGLTHYRPGEPPLHGFTSPFSVLIPLLADVFRPGLGLEFIKLVSLPAAGLTVIYLLGILLHPAIRMHPALVFAAAGYAALEHHQILFGMAGMETQIATCVLFMSMYYAIAWKPVPLGISLGLCMLARPDFAFWTLIAAAWIVYKQPRALPKVAGIALALYLPWILFTLAYYGSPVPNTVIAKGLGYHKWWDTDAGITWFTLKRHTWMTLSEHLLLFLAPVFGGHGAGIHQFFVRGPENPLGNAMFVFAVLGTLACVWGRRWHFAVICAFVVLYSVYYVYFVPVIFHWYKMPYLIALLALCLWGIQASASWLPGRAQGAVLWSFSAAYIALFAGVLPLTFHTERQIQRYVENGVRMQAGLFMRETMAAGHAVGCEPLGYMGYYSGGNVYDWPGLNSRTVVAWSQAHPGERSLEGMLRGLRPEYLFLRDVEIQRWFTDPSFIRADYHPIALFALAPEERERIPWLDRNIDTVFRIYRRNDLAAPPPASADLWPDWPESGAPTAGAALD